MAHLVTEIRLKMVIHLSRIFFFYLLYIFFKTKILRVTYIRKKRQKYWCSMQEKGLECLKVVDVIQDLSYANLSRSPRPLRAGQTNPCCILNQHTLSPIMSRSLPIRLFFQSGGEREMIGSLVWKGLYWLIIPFHTVYITKLDMHQ